MKLIVGFAMWTAANVMVWTIGGIYMTKEWLFAEIAICLALIAGVLI